MSDVKSKAIKIPVSLFDYIKHEASERHRSTQAQITYLCELGKIIDDRLSAKEIIDVKLGSKQLQVVDLKPVMDDRTQLDELFSKPGEHTLVIKRKQAMNSSETKEYDLLIEDAPPEKYKKREVQKNQNKKTTEHY